MKKFGLVLAAVAALAIGSFSASKPAQAEPGTILVVGGLGWGYCHVTYKKKVKRQTPLCWWHDEWHKRYWR